MAHKTFTFDLAVDVDDPVKQKLIEDMLLISGRNMLSKVMLLTDKRLPKIQFFVSDFKDGAREIKLEDTEGGN